MTITLSAGDYWHLRALANDAAAIELEATRAAATFKQRIAAANEAGRKLAEQLGIDPGKAYRWNDDTCELVAEP